MAPLIEHHIGYWGNVTSTIDWCENNYEVTKYIAEFWNTISNLIMTIPPILSYIHTIKILGSIEKCFIISYISIIIIGIGSWLFHMTLLYKMQLLDEIPMVWGSLLLIYVLMTIIYDKIENSLLFISGLIIYGVFVTSVYLLLVYPIIFQVSYGLLVVIVLYLDIYIAKNRPCDPNLFYLSAILYYSGFIIWNIDNLFCPQLTKLRSVLPFFLKPFTQLHAIWHILAGYGSFIHIFYCIQSKYLQKKLKVKYIWKNMNFYLVLENEKKIK